MWRAFHPAVSAWFESRFAVPTASQQAAWPPIQAGRDVLIAAPTGSGKTLAAFLASIDRLIEEGLAAGLADQTQVIYVSPLKALSNDIQRNLEEPLQEISAQLQRQGLVPPAIRTRVRSGDTAASDRLAMYRRPPHLLVTTPESLYLLLTSVSGRRLLGTARSIIVDEIHAVATSKRGAHLALSLERLDALCGRRLQRIGLSATQRPVKAVADFLCGAAEGGGSRQCVIIDRGHVRARHLELELPDAPLEAVMSGEVWQNVYDRLAQRVSAHRTTLIFANTRRMVERVTRHLSERLGEQQVAAHHGSLARTSRQQAEQRLKSGQLRALVATASLELGIDIGDVELVCQLGSPRSIATFLQRVGRANHAVTGVPKGLLYPLSRDDLVECTALLAAVRAGELERLQLPCAPLDVLAQQLVAEVAARECGEEELYALVRRAWPYRELTRADFESLLRMLGEGMVTRRGRQSAYLHRDAVHGRVRPRRGARLTAITCGGAIADSADYPVVLEPAGLTVGTLNEDFAVESLAGDIFQLGNASYRVLRIEAGRMRVEDARGLPPNIPFWLGEAPARTPELSAAVSQLRAEVEALLPAVDAATTAACADVLAQRHGLAPAAARQIADYLGAAKAMLGALPKQDTVVMERFFDEAGGMQLVIHAPLGGRINRALGLALRKRFCRQFNFELQAAAGEDAIVLSLGETQSFALEEVARYLNSSTVATVLTQAVLDSPLFATRWRWCASIALAIRRARAGARTPAPLQRMAAEDLVATVFPDQIACAENLAGEREIPDHPLVRQTIWDCLHEAMDLPGLVALLRDMEDGRVRVLARDLPHPSPLAAQILNAQPHTYLDDAPLEERRTRAVAARRWLDPQAAAQFGHLDAAAIQTVRAEAWPELRNGEELHDALMSLGVVVQEQGMAAGWSGYLETLMLEGRAVRLRRPHGALWSAVERLPLVQAAYPDARIPRSVAVPAAFSATSWTQAQAVLELLRGRLQVTGPATVVQLAAMLTLEESLIAAALPALEAEGFALQGRFTPAQDAAMPEWCERRLLARIHSYTLRRLRARIEPAPGAQFMRFLLEWQGVTRRPQAQGAESLLKVIEQLEGLEIPAAAWESDVLMARLGSYQREWLDSLCLSGRCLWMRLSVPRAVMAGPVRATPIGLMTRRNAPLWQALAAAATPPPPLSADATAVQGCLLRAGALFFDEIVTLTALLPGRAQTALGELVAAGRMNADGFGGLRALLLPAGRRRRRVAYGLGGAAVALAGAGRWSLTRRPDPDMNAMGESGFMAVAWTLLRRYGVVARALLAREAGWLPPWFELLRLYRRLEAQGEIRGGRFVAGFGGEQFALPEAVGLLRAQQANADEGRLVVLGAADPLNLSAIALPGARVPALAGNRVLLRDGMMVAARVGGEVQFMEAADSAAQWRMRQWLLRSPGRCNVADPTVGTGGNLSRQWLTAGGRRAG